MPRLVVIPVTTAVIALIWLWSSGGFDSVAAWAAGEQRDFQNQIARSLRALRRGDSGALALLMTLCFAYGFFHAVGPGHGKVLIGGYGLGRQVPWLRLSVISLISSLGQALTAIGLVYAGVLIFSFSRGQLIGAAEDYMAPVSYAAIGAIGMWLSVRALRKFAKLHHTKHDDHTHHDHGTCSECGHKHGPSISDVQQATSLRDALILIAGIAVRPCTGALFVLVITWQMGIAMAGIAGAFAMALGTAIVTISVGIAAVTMRSGMLASFSSSRFATHFVPLIELAAGLLVFTIAAGLLLRAL
ncbi:nickel/cobalt transporter [Litoreibacter arenae]|uniref:Nickel/cobalt efflux system n=1 Tax=Litoreibacter arenae DSM 19593 TaxID=1123360 RepID=S9RUI1_9RHOB|nr:membrane protein [Litoreibacter arenae]EPX81695.1 putative membrane protein [Litoreibacter arenae DSM 19593]